MFLLLSVVVGILIGLLRGGSLLRLAALEFRHGWLIFLGLFLQIVAFNDLLPAGFWAPLVHVLSYSALLVGIALNWRLWGLRVLGAGTLANTIAIAANGGYMPASEEALRLAGMEDQLAYITANGSLANSALLGEGSRLPFLTDILALPATVPLANVFSVGDLLIALGATVLVASAMVSAPRGATNDYRAALDLIRAWPAPAPGVRPAGNASWRKFRCQPQEQG